MKKEELKRLNKRLGLMLVLLCISICLTSSKAAAQEGKIAESDVIDYELFSMEERHELLLMAKWDFIRKSVQNQDNKHPDTDKEPELLKAEFLNTTEAILAKLIPLEDYETVKKNVYLMLKKEVDEEQYPDITDLESYEAYIQSLTDRRLDDIWIQPLDEAGLIKEILNRTGVFDMKAYMEDQKHKTDDPEGEPTDQQEQDSKQEEKKGEEKEDEEKEEEQWNKEKKDKWVDKEEKKEDKKEGDKKEGDKKEGDKKEEGKNNLEKEASQEQNGKETEDQEKKEQDNRNTPVATAAGTTNVVRTRMEQEGSGYWVYNYISSNTGISKTQYYAWTVKNGQDELTCTNGTAGNWSLDGENYNWRVYVNQKEHKSEWGVYATHLYVTETSGAVDRYVFGDINLLNKGARTVTDFRELKVAATDTTTKEIYILQNITLTESIHLSAKKSLLIKPCGAGRTLTMQKNLPSGFIAQGSVLELAGSEFHGNMFTLGINGNQNTEAATGAKYPSVVTAKSSTVKIGTGALIFNGGGHGVLGESGTIIYTDGAKLYQNGYAGIGTWGAIEIKRTEIYQNDTAGKGYGAIHLNTDRSSLNAFIQDCNIHDNKDSGINVIPTADTAGRIVIHMTKVERNGFQGVLLRHKGQSVIASGTVSNNLDVGIVNQSGLIISIADSGLSVQQKQEATAKGPLVVSGNRGQGLINEGTCEMRSVEVSNQSTHGVWNSGTLNLTEERVKGSSYPAICNNQENGIVNQSGTVNVRQGKIAGNGRGVLNQANLSWMGGAVEYSTRNGGIYNTGTLQITGGSVSNNRGNVYGGGIYNLGHCRISNTNISGNSASLKGGGIYNYGTLTISAVELMHNRSGYGGGIFNDKQCTISNSTLRGNRADSDGGGIFSEGYNGATIDHSAVLQSKGNKITDNFASGRGGGVFGNSTVSLENCNLSQNQASDGGGICNYGRMDLANTVVSQNSAVQGRGISHHESGNTLQLKGSTAVLAPDDIFLADNTYIWAGADLQKQSAVIAKITPQNYVVGRKVVQIEKSDFNQQGKASELLYTGDGKMRFELTEHSKEELIRPGDYLKPGTKGESKNVIETTEMIISRSYRMKYYPNTTAQVTEFPPDDVKYWSETKYLSKQIPKREPIRFLGWDENASKEERPFYQPGDPFDKNQDQNFYAVWEKDQPPVLKADEVLEFYEGEEVSKEQMLANINASDREDDYTGIKLQVRIKSVTYADGRLVDGEKVKGETVIWDQDMPDDYQLDTWYLQLEQADSPVTHIILYEVTDSVGNTTRLHWSIKVKYNEFPVMEASDRYFTLDEAQSGKVTAEELLKQVKAFDREDGDLTEKVILLGVKEEEFLHFQHSGYVLCTYQVTDRYRKETVRQSVAYIVKDGEKPPGPEVSYFRFINRKNYEKNAGIIEEDLTEEEKVAYNQNGGLHVDSKWYQEEECRVLLTDTLQEKKTYEIWRFRPRDVIAVDQYIKEHGIGDSRSEQALSQFASEFSHLKENR